MAKIKGKTYLSQFKRKGDVSCYVMRLSNNGSVNEADIASDNAQDSRLSKPYVEATVKALTGSMVKALCAGKRVDTEYFSIQPSCKGRFKDPTDKFDPARHSIELNFIPKKKLRQLLATLEVENVTAHVKVTLTLIRCEGVDEKDVIKLGVRFFGEGEGLTQIEGREDEYVALLDLETRKIVAKATVSESSVGTLVGMFAEDAVEPGDYLFLVASRNGGDESLTPFTAERKVKVIR